MAAALEVVALPAKGRGVVARRSFRRGEVLFSEEPYAFVISVL